MENLQIGNIAIATLIVGILDLIIVVLVRTETILKAVERIKGVIKLDYKSRAKRSDDEIRLYRKHELVARERVRHSFIRMERWDCRWTWNWSKELEPINIKGFCVGKEWGGGECEHPIYPAYGRTTMGRIVMELNCTNEVPALHYNPRARFDISNEDSSKPAEELLLPMVSKAILSERDLKIAEEIKKFNWQFWK